MLREEQAEELIQTAAERGLILMVGHLLQYHAAFIKLKELVAQGELGRINYICSHRLNLGKIRQEENILWSFAPHDISMVLSLAKEMPDHVVATGGYYLQQEIADVTTTHLSFPSGLKAHIFVSWLHPFKEQKLVVIGDKKMAVFDDTLPWGEKLTLYPYRVDWQDNHPVSSKSQAEPVPLVEAEPLRAECQHFLDCVATGERPRTDGKEGLAVLRVLNASQRSLDQGYGQVRATAAVPEAAPTAKPDYFAHPTAVIEKDVEIGQGCKIWLFSHLLPGTRLGPGCNVGQNVVIGPDVTVGQGCKIQNNVSLYKGVTLEDEVFCGPSMVFTNVINPRAGIGRMDEALPTLIKHGASLGANSTIVCGHDVGRYAFVGAGAVVTKNVLDHALVVGNPARRIGWMCACGVRLDENLACPACGKRYQETDAGLVEEA